MFPTDLTGPSKAAVFGIVASILASLPLEATAAAIPAEGRGETSSGRANCVTQAMTEARRKALTKAVISIFGAFDPGRHRPMLGVAEGFVKKEQQRGKPRFSGQFCTVTARFRFDERAIRDWSKANVAGGGRVGVVVRYVVNGRLAQAAGVNPLAGQRALQSELLKYNCQLVNMLFEFDEFSERMQEQRIPLPGNDEELERIYEKGLSHAQAVLNALRAAREELTLRLRSDKGGFEHVIAAHVVVQDRGRSADTGHHVAQAITQMTLFTVIEGDPVAVAEETPVPAARPAVESARALAMQTSIESAVRTLSSQSSICSR